MNEYLATKSHLTNKILEWVDDIQLLEKQTDIRRYPFFVSLHVKAGHLTGSFCFFRNR